MTKNCIVFNAQYHCIFEIESFHKNALKIIKIKFYRVITHKEVISDISAD